MGCVAGVGRGCRAAVGSCWDLFAIEILCKQASSLQLRLPYGDRAVDDAEEGQARLSEEEVRDGGGREVRWVG